MLILVANLGSTSFKFRLFRFTEAGETELAKGGVDRLGSPQGRSYVQSGATKRETLGLVADHAEAIEACLALLDVGHVSNVPGENGALETCPTKIDAIGFKAVHGGQVTGVQLVDERVLAAMEDYADVAPAHNPVYVAAMRLLQSKLPDVPLVAAFETGFHQTIPAARQAYAIPQEWAKLGVRRYGFHGASHRYIAERTAQLLGRTDAKIISCHLGGSSSLCAIDSGVSQAASMGFSPQSGLPQNNRVGDLDVFALPWLLRRTGRPLPALLKELDSQGGLLGLSGSTNDLKELAEQAEAGAVTAKNALAAYVEAVRHYLGAYLVALGGADAIAFTGGIGENSALIRRLVCDNLAWFGVELDPTKNDLAKGEAALQKAGSRVQLWTIPTNEELIVARQTRDLLASRGA